MVIVRIVLGGICIGLAVFFVMCFLSPPLPFHHPWCATNWNDLTNLIIAVILLWIGKRIIRHLRAIDAIILTVIVLCMTITAFIITPHRHGSVVANEASAIAVLKMLVVHNNTWRCTDVDGNGIGDYWTLDVSCLNRMYRANGTTKVAMIDVAVARADANAYSRDNPSPFDSGNPNGLDIEDWGSAPVSNTNLTTTAKSGYYYRAMLRDENGVPYNQNPVGKNQIKACNIRKFAFVAYPAVYGAFSVNTFIVNEQGIIYQANCMSDGKKIVLQWPGVDPTKVKGPGGEYWQLAE